MLEIIMNILWSIAAAAIAYFAVRAFPMVKMLAEKYLPKWLLSVVTSGIVSLAETYVRREEEIGGTGEEKFEAVFAKLITWVEGFGVDIDTELVIAAIQAAWARMNAEQIASGEKKVF